MHLWQIARNLDCFLETDYIFSSKINFFKALQNGKAVLPLYENGNGKQYQGVVKTTDYAPIIELMRFVRNGSKTV